MVFYDTFNSAFWLSMTSLLLICLLNSLRLCYQCKIKEYHCCGIVLHRDINLEIEEESRMIDKIPSSRRASLLPI